MGFADKRQSLKEFTENNYAQGSFFWNYLLKNKDISLGTDFLSGSTTGDSNYEAESSSKEFKRNKVLLKDIDKGDEL